MAVADAGGAGHAELARAVAGGVGVAGQGGDFGRLGGGCRCGQFGMQHAAVAGERTASPRVRGDDLVGHALGDSTEGVVQSHLGGRAGRMQHQA